VLATATLVPALALIHAIHVAPAEASATTTTTVWLRFRMVHMHKTAWAVAHFRFFLVDGANLAIDFLDFFFQRFFLLFHLLQLLLNAETVVSLEDLLVDEVPPRLRVELVVEIKLVPLRLIHPHPHNLVQ